MSESRLEEESPPWTKVTVRVSCPAEEGLANLLSELGASGLIIQEDPSSCLRLTAFFPPLSDLPPKVETISCYLDSLKDLGIDPGPAQVEVLPWRETGESERWKHFFKPLLLGRRLVIKPTWENYPSDPSEVIIEIDPGGAFGTGRHPTTAACLRFLERWVRGGETVLDLGTGSGILAIAALKLGAQSVKALEIDREAARVALQNCQLNRVRERVEIIGGSLSSLSAETFDIVVANLTFQEILPLVSELASHLTPYKGIAFLAGILRRELSSLEAALGISGLHLVEWEFQGEWIGVGVRA
jgi:ribosomal protein L11 methyltransferase